MSDLISRENAKDMFCEHCDERVLFGLDVDVCREKCRCGLMRMLDKVKTVDAVPVVRCVECEYVSFTTLGMPYACWHGSAKVFGETGEHAGQTVCTRVDSLDHYCAYGKNREGEKR